MPESVLMEPSQRLTTGQLCLIAQKSRRQLPQLPVDAALVIARSKILNLKPKTEYEKKYL